MAEIMQCLSPNRFMEVGVPLPQEEPVKPSTNTCSSRWKWALVTLISVLVVSCGIVYMIYLSGNLEQVGGENETTEAPTNGADTTVAPSILQQPISTISPTLYPSPAPMYTIDTPQMTLAPTSNAPQGAPLTYNGWCSEEAPCFECQGQCFSSEDCFGELVCFVRAGFTNIPGCAGSGIYGVSYCYQPLAQELMLEIVNECSPYSPCGECQGDCNDHEDCAGNLICFERLGDTQVPGCTGTGETSRDYCIKATPTVAPSRSPTKAPVTTVAPTPFPTSLWPPTPFPTAGETPAPTTRPPTPRPSIDQPVQPPTLGQVPAPQPTQQTEPVLYGTGDCSPTSQCRLCEGDCDSDGDCTGNLVCFMRTDFESVPGCSGGGINRKDYCYDSSFSNIFADSLQANADCTISQPCDRCRGDCTQDADCKGNLVCFRRTSGEPVPGCVSGGGGDIEQANYCHEPLEGGPVSFIPGDLTVNENGLLLSTGLTARIIARYGDPVTYDTGGQSAIPFHKDPDAAAVFETTDGGWIYVSNSEDVPGGVGAIRFNSNGEVIDYRMVATNSTDNCGGGKMWWNTWLTCEEKTGGYVHEVDPWGIKPERIVPLMGSGRLESAAYYRPTQGTPTFYVTEDLEDGALRRFTPDGLAVANANMRNEFSDLLHSNATGTATLEFLKLNAQTSNSGTFSWTQDLSAAREDARQYYSFSEGIDIARGVIYVTAKKPKKLLILDIERGTWELTSTESGAFDKQPDQVRFILGDNAQEDVLFFCEDGGENSGVHGRDSQGNFYNVLNGKYDTETSGLAFSPDNTRMYVSYQENPGLVFEVKRRDGYPFAGTRLDIKYSRVKS